MARNREGNFIAAISLTRKSRHQRIHCGDRISYTAVQQCFPIANLLLLLRHCDIKVVMNPLWAYLRGLIGFLHATGKVADQP